MDTRLRGYDNLIESNTLDKKPHGKIMRLFYEVINPIPVIMSRTDIRKNTIPINNAGSINITNDLPKSIECISEIPCIKIIAYQTKKTIEKNA
jgi:hypothetical protein